MKRLTTHLSRKFVAGLIAAGPALLLIAVLVWLEELTRAFLEPLGFYFPGLGVLLAIVAIYGLGVLVTSLLGIVLFRLVDRILGRVPLLREVYRVWSDVIGPVKAGMFRRVVLVTSSGAASAQVGFTSGDALAEDPEALSVFLPGLPNPLTGRLITAKRSDCRTLDVSVDDALKLLLSLGGQVPIPAQNRSPEYNAAAARHGP